VSDSAAPELASFHELEQLVRNLGDELAGFRRRALTAENRLKALEVASGPGDLFSHERLAAAEQENAELKRRLAAATERTNQVVAQLRFLRQQHERAGSDR
jgi:small-conductance mechanosensitive channel